MGVMSGLLTVHDERMILPHRAEEPVWSVSQPQPHTRCQRFSGEPFRLCSNVRGEVSESKARSLLSVFFCGEDLPFLGCAT